MREKAKAYALLALLAFGDVRLKPDVVCQVSVLVVNRGNRHAVPEQ